jgi:signal transduction histidine kinase
MKGILLSRIPGTIVAALLELSAFVFLFSGQAAFTGTDEARTFSLVLFGLFPVTTVVIALVKNSHRIVQFLLVKGLVVFWGTLPEASFLPSRWLVYAALVAEACTVLPVRWKAPLSVGFAAELISVQHLIPGMTDEPVPALVTAVVVFCLAIPGFLLHWIQHIGARLELLADRNDKLHASVLQLTSANTEFLEQANTASEESAVHERHRITRDLHDVVGQTLTNIIMMMDAALHRSAHEPEETVKLLRWIRKQAQTGLQETRGVLYELRALRPARIRGLRSLKVLVETFSRLSRIKTRVEWGNLPWTFDPSQETAVYHLVQESLSNAFRHGAASRIDLHFQVDRGILHIMVRDNGKGGPDSSLGLGQRGMEERLARWGGSVTFQSEPYGYVVTAALPLQEAGHEFVSNLDRR